VLMISNLELNSGNWWTKTFKCH